MVNKNFLNSSKEYYLSDVFFEDLSKESTAEMMGKWVSEKTRNMINSKIMPDKDTLVTLFNTLYFESKWKKEFDKNDNKNFKFKLPNGSEVEKTFMAKNKETGEYYKGSNFQMANMQFKNFIKIEFVLPDENVKIEDMIKDENKLKEILNAKLKFLLLKIPSIKGKLIVTEVMMKLCTLSSGSTGNSIFVQSDKSKILIDCGLTGKLAVELLQSIGEKPEDLNAIFVTHEHIDHIKGVGILSRKYDIPILANEKTWIAMKDKIGKIDPKNINVFKSNTFFTFRDLDVQVVSTFHDAVDPVFFIFYQNNQKISILTDTGITSQLIVDSIRDSNILLLESNHDIEMLENGPYPIDLKYRIKGEYGHLSNDLASSIMKDIVNANGEKLILGHLSKTNNTPKTALESMKNELENIGIDVNKDIEIEVAEEFKSGKIIDLGGKYI
ncbi:serpin family protein [Helcococcus bovis]|uniref:serpin family protein n=1 Tax=Helcococcus bovis TaxID=3153252 RepID=UPI0038B7A00B